MWKDVLMRGNLLFCVDAAVVVNLHFLRCINHLIPEFYEGELAGVCLIDGNDISGQSIGEVGKQVASVFQDPRSQFFYCK